MNSISNGLYALKELQSTIAAIAIDNHFTEPQKVKYLNFARAFSRNVQMVERSYHTPLVKSIIDDHTVITEGLHEIIIDAKQLDVADQYSIMFGVAIKTVGLIELVIDYLDDSEPEQLSFNPNLKYELMERLDLEDAYQQRLAQRLK